MDQDQLLRIGHTASAYYRQAEAEPEPRHFDDWINSMAEPMRTVFRKKGFEACKGVLNFRRFVAELNDEGMEEYMRQHLSAEDYSYWRAHGK